MVNAEFQEVASAYYGMPSPACAGLIGEQIATTRHVLDAHGALLASLPLPGDGWRTQHDAIKWRLYEDLKEMGVRCRSEIFGLFAQCIPQTGRRQANQQPVRKRQGLVPDFHITVAAEGPERPLLYELKTLHYGRSTYPLPAERCAAVARRAERLPAEYATKAREVDRKFCGTAACSEVQSCRA